MVASIAMGLIAGAALAIAVSHTFKAHRERRRDMKDLARCKEQWARYRAATARIEPMK